MCMLGIFMNTMYINLIWKMFGFWLCWSSTKPNWPNIQCNTFWSKDRHELYMHVVWYGLTWMFVHAKRPPEYYVLFVNCHVCITLSTDKAVDVNVYNNVIHVICIKHYPQNGCPMDSTRSTGCFCLYLYWEVRL